MCHRHHSPRRSHAKAKNEDGSQASSVSRSRSAQLTCLLLKLCSIIKFSSVTLFRNSSSIFWVDLTVQITKMYFSYQSHKTWHNQSLCLIFKILLLYSVTVSLALFHRFFELFEKHGGYKSGKLKLKKPKQLQVRHLFSLTFRRELTFPLWIPRQICFVKQFKFQVSDLNCICFILF